MTRRRLYEPISRDDDPRSRARRLQAVDADAALAATGQPCPVCDQEARCAGGEGCRCRTSGASGLVARALAHADAARGARP